MASITDNRRSHPRPSTTKPATSAQREPITATSGKPPVVLASVPRRMAGAVIDSLLVLVALAVVTPWLRPETAVIQVRIDAVTGERTTIDPHAGIFDLVAVLPFLLTAAYFIVFIALWGRTLGGWAVGVRCLNARTGGRPGWAVSAKRWGVLFGIAGVLSIVPVIGPWSWLLTIAIGVSPLWDRTGWLRGYHDRFAGDIVVRS